ncbi:c-type cytochrome [Fodinibius sp. SL11]|uniref:c-type cytochrome n=1 Tax=Fodinibius sp. SL11 TaxID=3425690 RepID=UPI003F882C83
MKVSKYLLFVVIVLPLALAGCRGEKFQSQPVHPNLNMDQQKRFEQQEKNKFFADNRAMRMPVEGTIARGNLKEDKALYQGINEDSSFVNEIPVDVTKSFIYRGKDRYEVFCTPCHGIAGDGNGIVMANNYGYVPAPSFHIDRLRNQSDGYFYSAIANGIRNMPSYATQIPVKDRWAIVAYVRALQQSQNVSEDEIQEYDVDLSALEDDFQEKLAAEQAQKEAQAASGGGEVSVDRGKTVAQNNGCATCHSTDGTKLVGPTWQNLYGSERTFDDGSTTTADEDYLRESIMEPSAKVVEGFPPSMVPYDYLSDSEINSLVAYIKSLSENAE